MRVHLMIRDRDRVEAQVNEGALKERIQIWSAQEATGDAALCGASWSVEYGVGESRDSPSLTSK